MKLPLSWLSDYLHTTAEAGRMAEALTELGLEVEGMHDTAGALGAFVVAEIRAAAPHPGASKLQVCTVWDGSVERQIVCGAANARAGLKTVLAREGVFIPGSGITIKKTKIRDVESNGMLCSLEELGLAESSEGIVELPPQATPGAPAAEALGAEGPVLEVNVTPNRADCLGVFGIARDLAAAGLGTLKPLEIPTLSGAAGTLPVKISTPHCPAFIAVQISGVKNGPSPAWLQARLKAVGLKPISALVDITNYFTHAFARPLHVFDAAKLSGGISVRMARAGETLEALDGKTYALDERMMVIADDARVCGLAGIMGGAATGVSDTTTDVVLEVALFAPTTVAEAGRALGILSDARARFERGVDPAFLEPAAALATRMILDVCGGQAHQPVMSGAVPAWQRRIPFDAEHVKTLGGADVPRARAEHILEALGCTLTITTNRTEVSPPSWRADIEHSADLVEEVLRMHGYQHIKSTPLSPPSGVFTPTFSPAAARIRTARHALVARGALEACSYSFLSEAEAARFGGQHESLALANPISADLAVMRPSLLPNLLAAARNNHHRGVASVALFEAGFSFHADAQSKQRPAVACVRSGMSEDHAYPDARFAATAREADAFDAKADALAVLAALGVNPASVSLSREAPAWFHPGRAGTLLLGKKMVLGHFGELHPAVLAASDIKGRASACELWLDALPPARSKGTARAALPALPYPAVARDFAWVVDANLPVADVLRAVASADKALIREVKLFDVFIGKGVPEGKKSVAVQVTLQSAERTLAEADISAVTAAILAATGKECGAELRG